MYSTLEMHSVCEWCHLVNKKAQKVGAECTETINVTSFSRETKWALVISMEAQEVGALFGISTWHVNKLSSC